MKKIEIIHLLAAALYQQVCYRSENRRSDAGAVGVVQEFYNAKTEKNKKYIIKFVFNTKGDIENWGVIPTTSNKCHQGDIIHYHDTEEEVVTKAALFGDGVMDSDEDV